MVPGGGPGPGSGADRPAGEGQPRAEAARGGRAWAARLRLRAAPGRAVGGGRDAP